MGLRGENLKVCYWAIEGGWISKNKHGDGSYKNKHG